MGSVRYIGFDFSTQQVKVVGADEKLSICYERGVRFDEDLPHYGTKGGVLTGPDQLTVTAPTLMWVEALDLLLNRMVTDGFSFSDILALSGCGQQHGSVYWTHGAEEKCLGLMDDSPEIDLHVILKDAFSITQSPVWMDCSTSDQCASLEESAGGPQLLAEITGSRAYERFTGPQILKQIQQNYVQYEVTERISVVSSFAASLFLGKYAAIDESDGSGMNMMDLRTRNWNSDIVQSMDSSLQKKMGVIVPSQTTLGTISTYFVKKYGFPSDCRVVAFTGDNPASLAGMRLQPRDAVVSLGTSDTLFLWIDGEPHPALQGHVFVNPVHSPAYMALLCYKNGSLTRERVRDRCYNSSSQSWREFSEALENTPPGNDGNIGLYFEVQEITPNASGVYRFNANDEAVDGFESAIEVRALVEGQFLAKKAHAEQLGYNMGPGSRILATGGASSNNAILQVLSDVFGVPVYVQNAPNSACVGGAYRAAHALQTHLTFSQVLVNVPPLTQAVRPSTNSQEVYKDMVKRYMKLEATVTADQSP